jgi:hypothetical protein
VPAMPGQVPLLTHDAHHCRAAVDHIEFTRISSSRAAARLTSIIRPRSIRPATGQIDIDDKAAANESLTSIIGSEHPAIY